MNVDELGPESIWSSESFTKAEDCKLQRQLASHLGGQVIRSGAAAKREARAHLETFGFWLQSWINLANLKV